MNLTRKLRLGCLIGLLIFTVGCDQTSKHLARSGLGQASSVILPGGLVELRLAENRGSFLSLGAALPDWARFAVFTLGVGVGLLALATYLISRSRIDLMRFVGLSLVTTGGISNLLDRVFRQGAVTDFAIIRVGTIHTGIFNIADVLIMIGVGVIIWSLRKRRLSDSPTNLLGR